MGDLGRLSFYFWEFSLLSLKSRTMLTHFCVSRKSCQYPRSIFWKFEGYTILASIEASLFVETSHTVPPHESVASYHHVSQLFVGRYSSFFFVRLQRLVTPHLFFKALFSLQPRSDFPFAFLYEYKTRMIWLLLTWRNKYEHLPSGVSFVVLANWIGGRW